MHNLAATQLFFWTEARPRSKCSPDTDVQAFSCCPLTIKHCWSSILLCPEIIAVCRHALIEDIYWDAKQAADAQRNLSRPRNETIDTIRVIRLYDLWTPDYNCPFLKERVGRIGDGGKWVRQAALTSIRSCAPLPCPRSSTLSCTAALQVQLSS